MQIYLPQGMSLADPVVLTSLKKTPTTMQLPV